MQLSRYAAESPAGRRIWMAVDARSGAAVGHASLRLDADLRRVELGVFTHNASAVRLYERLSFVCDRVLHDVERVDGRPWCAMQMSVQRSGRQVAAPWADGHRPGHRCSRSLAVGQHGA